jgi:hypothetical protein
MKCEGSLRFVWRFTFAILDVVRDGMNRYSTDGI